MPLNGEQNEATQPNYSFNSTHTSRRGVNSYVATSMNTYACNSVKVGCLWLRYIAAIVLTSAAITVAQAMVYSKVFSPYQFSVLIGKLFQSLYFYSQRGCFCSQEAGLVLDGLDGLARLGHLVDETLINLDRAICLGPCYMFQAVPVHIRTYTRTWK